VKNFITLFLIMCCNFCWAQNWQIQHDSALYFLEIGFNTKAIKTASRLPDTKDVKQQYKKLILLSLIQKQQANLRTSLRYLDQATALTSNKKLRFDNSDFIDLQFQYCNLYFDMNELGKADSILEIIREPVKIMPSEYFNTKYAILKKTGKQEEANELLENDIQPNYYLYRMIPLDNYIEAGEMELAASETEAVLAEFKALYPDQSAFVVEQLYPYRLESATSFSELKKIISEGIWQGKYTTQFEWMKIIATRAHTFNERAFGDSILNKVIDISTRTLGERNSYHSDALTMLLRAALANDDFIKARGYAEKSETLLKVLFGEESVMFRSSMHDVLRYRIALGYHDAVNEFCKKSLEIIEKEAGKKHATYSTFASYYFKWNPQSKEAGQYLQEAVKQYDLDDANCNGCYALVLSKMASYYEQTNDVVQAEHYFRRAWEKASVVPEDEIFYRRLLTDFYRRCHALKLRSMLKYFPEEIRTLRNDSLFVTYKDFDADMIYISGLYENYDAALKGASLTDRNEMNYAKAKLAWSENKETEATIAFENILTELVKGLDVLEYLNEKEKSSYFRSVSDPINAFYSFSISLNTLSTGFLMEDKYLDYIKQKLNADSSSYKIEQVKLNGKNYFQFTLLHGKKALNMRLATKGMVFASTRKVQNRILNSGDTTLIRKFHHLERLKKDLASIYIADSKKISDKEKTIQQLTLQVDALEIELAEKSAVFKKASQTKKVSFEDIQSKLKPGEAAVEVIRINNPLYYLSDKLQNTDSVYYAFFIITPENKIKPEVIVLKNGYDLEHKYFKAYKNSIRFKLDDRQSYNQYWRAIMSKLAYRKKIYFSPDGIYNLISLNTLKDPIQNKYLLEQSDITLLPDLKLLMEEDESYGLNNSSVIIGDPAFSETNEGKEEKPDQDRSFQITDLLGKQIPRLTGTLAEVQTIEQLLQNIHWKTVLFTGSRATENNLKEIKSPSLVHIATHGFFFSGDKASNNPLLLSGLIMAGVIHDKGVEDEDGVLTAYEAQALNLSSTELVVLSACETGSGVVTSGDGVYGLQRAFMTAGAKNVIMSLWSVDDATTSLLMRTFYREWTNGANKGDALKKAELEVKKQYPDPYYWGAFVMLGK
jgi:CHAT domain-containing protein